MKKLSILIASIPQRREKLNELLTVLAPQITDDVEVIINMDKGMKIGQKRNALVSAAMGYYVIFIDDDDLVSDKYVSLLLGAMDSNPDTISIEGLYCPSAMKVGIRFSQQLGAKWGILDNVMIRGVTHISAVQRNVAVKCPFPETNYGEDRVYEEAIKKYVENGIHIKSPIYFHRYNEVKEYEL